MKFKFKWAGPLPTVPLVGGEAAVRGDLNEHSVIRQIQEHWSLPIPTSITSQPYSREQSPLQLWYHASPVISASPAFSDSAYTVPVPQFPSAPPPASTPSVDINDIVKEVFQATLAANAASIAENHTAPYLSPTLTHPTG